MKYYYSLRIEVEEDKTKQVDQILGVSQNMPNLNWGLEIQTKKDDIAFDFINYFIGILKNNYEKLEDIGVKREDISIWMLYEYDQQCNMEFLPEQLFKIGEEKIALCISCWEA
jgi:uncharacterized protein YegJ (DUF2314 family)